jgi:predicted permease
MTTFIHDIRFALRTLCNTPIVTAIVVLSLALGIGANSAIFTIVNALLLKSLPVDRPEQLVLYSEGRTRGFVAGQEGGQWQIFSYPLYREIRAQQKSFEGVAAFRSQVDQLSIREEGADSSATPQVAWGRLVSGNYFNVLGVRPAAGGGQPPPHPEAGAAPVAVLSHDYWQRRFAGTQAIVGRAVNVNGLFVTVAGVAPPEFFGESVENQVADLWLPLTLIERLMPRRGVIENAGTGWLNMIARLRPGVTIASAQPEANVLFQRFLMSQFGAKASPDEKEQLRRSFITLSSGASGVSALRQRYSRPLHILLAIVGLVLLITCANVANVLLSRAAARTKEISMRIAMGARRTRLLRQLLTESLVLSGLGAALGLLLSSWMVQVLVSAVSTGDRTAPLDVAPDARFLAFAIALFFSTALVFGLAPALRAMRVDVWPSLKSSRIGADGLSRWSLARTLVVAQVALSMPLIAGAGLFVRTLQQLSNQDFGFTHERVLEVGIAPMIAGYRPDRVESLYHPLLERVRAVPGVSAASVSLYSPMSGNNWSGQIRVEGYTPPPKQGANCQWVWVGSDYATTVGLKLLAGRDFNDRDTGAAPKVAVVNETFAKRYFGGASPIGRRFEMSGASTEIVGMVKDFKFNDPRQNTWPVAFLPIGQAAMPPARFASALEVRTTCDPTTAAAAVREAVRSVDRNLPITRMRTLTSQVNDTLNRERLIAGLSSFFALLALLLACVGVYGVLAYSVARRTSEIGVRIALGARRDHILRMILSEALALACIGLAAGVLASVALAKMITAQLYGVKPTDVATLATAALILLASAAFAGFLPARRATRIDPMLTLRAD